MEIIKANRLILNRMNEFVHDAGNAWAPMGAIKTKDLAEAFDVLADKVVRVTFTSHGDHGEDDKKVYGRRLAKLPPYYVRSPWKNVEIRGIAMDNSFECTVTRMMP